MEATVNTPTVTSWRTGALALALVSIAYAPVSWLVDGITPSYVVYPLLLLVGLWRYRHGAGMLFFGVTATIFVIVHAPFTWAAVAGGTNPANGSPVHHPVEWIVSLLVLPVLTATAGFVAWRREGAAR